MDEWIRRQHDRSGVERFARHHDELVERHGQTLTGRWRDRLPASPPAPGQQYAFDVDLDACTGCKACVAACSNLNGLDPDEQWRRVGALHERTDPPVGRGRSSSSATAPAAPVTVTSACHHCVEPACLDGCPARAYEKDALTGIVRHLDDACIGCSYCTLTCPYEVPVLNRDLGIVRKCDLCSDRLAVGQAPACVQGCPQGAITIAVVDVADLIDGVRPASDAPTTRLVPTAPPSRLTVPTTTYRSARPLPSSLVAGDEACVHPSHAHAPLAVMLVLTQTAVGASVAGAVLAEAAAPAGGAAATTALATTSLMTALVALAASTLHLGRPLLAWRALLGLRRSWLSREIAAFGAYAGASVAHAGLLFAGVGGPILGLTRTAAVLTGLAGVACSAQLYAVTGRRWWALPLTATRFAATAAVGGLLVTAAVLAATDPVRLAADAATLEIATLAALATSAAVPWAVLARPRSSEIVGTRRLASGPLRPELALRWLMAGGAATIATLGLSAARTTPAGRADGWLVGTLALATLIAVGGEVIERRLFFRASFASRMPRSPR